MTQFLAKWFRKFHRWIAVPTALLIPAAVIIKLAGSPEVVAAWEKLDKVPSLLMLVMAISGTYLFLLPYIVKGLRNRKRAAAQRAWMPFQPNNGEERASDTPVVGSTEPVS